MPSRIMRMRQGARDTMLSRVRRFSRNLPYPIRWRLRLLRRALMDRARHVRFASTQAGAEDYAHPVCLYRLPLRCYPGQEHRFEGKRNNIDRALMAIDGTVIAAGETFSFWRAVGRPTARHGYMTAAALKSGILTEDIGGALCLASTLIYNAALISGMTIVERRCHSVDSYGDDRYFELGRDAAVEYAYLDLRFRNDLGAPLRLTCAFDGETIVTRVRSRERPRFSVRVRVSGPTSSEDGAHVHVRTRRVVCVDGAVRRDDLGESVYATPSSVARRRGSIPA